MAGRPSGVRPSEPSNGRVEGSRQQRVAGALGDEQSLADSEQTLAETDQTLADVDQSASDSDQASADTDQAASDGDQAASDRDLAHGGDVQTHDVSREIRQRGARQRDQTGAARLLIATQRDQTADARDLAARARDQAAAARDIAMAQRDVACEQYDSALAVTRAEVVARAAGQRKRAAQQRADSAAQRALAAADREAAARDRDAGARERRQALADREALARALAASETDPLTGARMRAAGLTDLDHELDRCRRTGGTLVVAYVDVIGLKRLNDSAGHATGDDLLKRVVALMQAHLRSYDLIIRLGGDEFLCVISNMTLADAHERFSQVADALAASPDGGALRTGFAELLSGDDDAADLIARADDDLLEGRRDRTAP